MPASQAGRRRFEPGLPLHRINNLARTEKNALLRLLHFQSSLSQNRGFHCLNTSVSRHFAASIKSAEVQKWLKPKKRKRFHFHFTPTSCSWLNQVERFFAFITGRMIRRGTFRSTDELETVIYKWLASWNGQPSPFVWKASADVILDKVKRCKELSKTAD